MIAVRLPQPAGKEARAYWLRDRGDGRRYVAPTKQDWRRADHGGGAKKGLHAPFVSHTPARTEQRLALVVITCFGDWVGRNEKYLPVWNLGLISMPKKQWKLVLESRISVETWLERQRHDEFCRRTVKVLSRNGGTVRAIAPIKRRAGGLEEDRLYGETRPFGNDGMSPELTGVADLCFTLLSAEAYPYKRSLDLWPSIPAGTGRVTKRQITGGSSRTVNFAFNGRSLAASLSSAGREQRGGRRRRRPPAALAKKTDNSGGARRRRRRRPPTASRLKGPRKQKRFAYKLLKRGLAKSFAYKLLKRGLANLMSPTSTSGVAPPLEDTVTLWNMCTQNSINGIAIMPVLCAHVVGDSRIGRPEERAGREWAAATDKLMLNHQLLVAPTPPRRLLAITCPVRKGGQTNSTLKDN
ncbi:hypothetical protein EVAR_100209_1 [Eumeta japonica]|uniref:Uncharacterized protein n=1 Tax=Eumeta variegata TaxID=151549 RepID=A0A4C1ZLG5_EUMVA|nr:hypothetical protein EVAR_100209_1 [Eumeta japonica]